MSALPAGTEAVACCRALYCVLAAEAVTASAHGIPVARPEDRFPGQAASCLAAAARTVK